MPRKGRRETVGKGIYKNPGAGTFTVRVVVGGTAYEATMPADSTVDELKTKRTALELAGRTATPRAELGSLRKAVPTYLRLVDHLASKDDLEDHLIAWCAELGDVQRHRITGQDVERVRARWRAAGLAPKTINNRCDTLRNLYHRLDGKTAPTPCAEVPHLKTPKTIIQRVSDALILTVDRNLQQREQQAHCHFDGAKTRARFRVFVSTGKRPCEIMRAQRGDVDLKARVWVPRDAKGGYCAGVYLNDDQRAAWQLFIDADAWGPYNHASFARVIRNAGWPKDVRTYQARHTYGITLSEAGVDLSDISAALGHTDERTTRRAYTPVLNSRLQRLSETIDGRFRAWGMIPKRGSAKSPMKTARKSAG